jgi:hypothetical protein
MHDASRQKQSALLRLHHALALLGLLACLALAPAPAGSSTLYDAVFDFQFSVVNGNPNGVWSYGESPSATGAFTAHTTSSSTPSLLSWLNSAGAFPENYPLIAKNQTAGDLDLGGGQLLPNDVLWMHPGCEPSTTWSPCGTGESWSVLRFTAPNEGAFGFLGSFRGLTATSSEIAVSFGGSILDVLSGNDEIDGAEVQDFGFVVSLMAGESVDFRVGPRGNILGDSTLLQLRAVVPEPSALALAGSGIAIIAAAVRRASLRRG